MTTPKLRYTKPPSMTYHVDVWCDGPKCDMQRLEHNGDGWTCDICGTFWDYPEGAGMDATESWGDELDDLPLYDEVGNEINVNNQTRAEEITLYRIVFRSPSDGSINGVTEWMETKPPMPPSYGTVIQVSGTPIEAVYDEGETR